MSKFIADDYEAINARLRELQGERKPQGSQGTTAPYCWDCGAKGWVSFPGGLFGTVKYFVCEICHNPEGLPQP